MLTTVVFFLCLQGINKKPLILEIEENKTELIVK